MNKRIRNIVFDHWFLAALAAAIVLAHFTSAFGKSIDAHGASVVAIVGLFLISGLTINLRSLNHMFGNWRSHALVQTFTFLIVPAVAVVTSLWLPPGPLRYGIYLLAVLPTTISSCIVFTVASGGSGLCAILNAVGSNLMGIIIAPLLLSLLLGRSGIGGMGHAGKTMMSMCWQVLVPFVAGQLIAWRFPGFREWMKKVQGGLAQWLVLLLSYCAFAKFLDKLSLHSPSMVLCFAYLVALQGVLVAAALLLGKLFRLPREDRPAMVFCSTQKTMAFGIPVANSFFPAALLDAGVTAPLIFYYLFQMVTASIVSRQMVRRGARGAMT